ncbi:hypothetical protein VV01_00150 [Luteipulveratus halotolerans]|uniref:Uncharacterized protein n=1 Tax=Luteipulveratus halotolerans TaxID=1631356 RepID=A0A0L6CPJ5_9MICO|nr:hypothetical protein VV01_00150 [Luteipulveratus halotolerans]
MSVQGVPRYFAAGADGMTHAVLSIDGVAEAMCATPLASGGVTSGETMHPDCMLIELARLAHEQDERARS